MKRTLKDIQNDINALCQEIIATMESKTLSKKAIRVKMEGFGKRKAKLDKERTLLSGGVQNPIPNCKIGKTKPVPEHHFCQPGQEPKTVIETRQRISS